MDTNISPQKDSLLHELNGSPTPNNPDLGLSTKATVIFLVITIVLGAISGYVYKKLPFWSSDSNNNNQFVSNQKAKEVAGVSGKKNFKDKVEGMLKKGGIDGEGSHHLERPGGVSQNVYLTSSTVDLTEFENKKVRVHGETFSGEKAGWLMDVGLVEVLQ